MGLGVTECAGAGATSAVLVLSVCPTERGDFLALDLGGTNFRVLLVRLTEGGVQIINQVYSIPECVAQGSGQQVLTASPDARGGGGGAGMEPAA